MATKSNLIANINGFITSVVNITKHRNSMLELVNELFATSTHSVVTVGNIQYDLTFTKSGNKCTLTGSISNSTSSIIGGVKLLDIPNSIYYPKNSTGFYGVKFISNNNASLLLADSSFIVPNSIFLNGSMGAYEIVSINTTYIVND